MNNMISIIIPTYKPSVIIKDTLQSIYRQTFNNYELIIVLNGCNTPYIDELNSYLTDLPLSAKIIQTDVSGVSNARNIGLENSKGKYVCFIDDDDLISESYLEELWRNRIDEGIVLSNVITFTNEGTNTVNPYSKVFAKLKACPTNSPYKLRHLLNGPWGKLYNREVIGETRFNTELSRGEDAVFNFEITKRIKKFNTTSNSTYYYYRLNPNGVTQNKVKLKEFLPIHITQIKYLTNLYIRNIGKYNKYLFVSRILGSYKYLFQNYITSFFKNSNK